jgi:alpha-L-rhamnosidase
LKGKGTEVYEPKFFYTGFRYVEVTTDKPDQLKSVDVEGRVVRTALEDNGKFVSSDSLLNKIHRATLWAIKSNTLSYPTDCPQREKGGYTGDGQIVAEATMHDFNVAAFYTNWLNDMQDVQEPNGRIPNTAPNLIGGTGGGVAWGSAYILVPWWMYNYYGDTRVLKDHFPTMKNWITYLHTLAKTDSNPEEPYIINNFGAYWYTLGEWCAPVKRDDPNHPMVHTYYYYRNCELLSKIATLLGEKEDAAKYASLADTIKRELNKKFFREATHLYGSDTTYQTYQLLALNSDIIPDGHREPILGTLIEDITKTHQNHMNVGIMGTKYMWPTLIQNGYDDLAWTLATQTTFPSFGYWINKGATTLREQWDGRASSNHQMFGAIDEYFYKYLAGIWSPMDGKTSLGYKHIHIQPSVPKGLNAASASLNTVAGKIESGWQKENGALKLKVTIPANTDAAINIPLGDIKNPTLKEKGKIIWQDGKYVSGDSGITQGLQDGNFLVFNVGSGNYEFTLSGK